MDILIAFTDNWGYVSLMVCQNWKSNRFVKMSCNKKSEAISVNVSYTNYIKIHQPILPNIILFYMGHLEFWYAQLSSYSEFDALYDVLSKITFNITIGVIITEKS